MMNRSPVAVLYDANGNALPVQDGAAIPASTPALMVAGSDGTNSQYLLVDSAGRLIVAQQEKATFSAWAPSVAIASAKSMISLVNTSGSTVVVRIHEIWVTNVRFTALTGVMGEFQVRRCVNHSAGTALTPQAFDTTLALDGSVTARTGATLTSESGTYLLRKFFSSDEYGPGTLDQEGAQATISNFIPVFKKEPPLSGIVLRANEGITIRFETASTAGVFDLGLVFTQE